MKCKEILENLNKIMPMELAMSWDNPGLLVGRRDCSVKRILLALDVTTEAIEQAVALGVDLLITHHPLIFSPLKKINDEDILEAEFFHWLKIISIILQCTQIMMWP